MSNQASKQDGFLGQKMFVLPPAIRQELEQHSIGNLLYITDIGYFPKAKYHSRQRESGANEEILIFCIEGEGIITTSEGEIALSANEFCLIRKGTIHNYTSNPFHPWSIYWVHFDGTKAADICQHIPIHDSIALRSAEGQGRIAMFNNFFNILEKEITSEHVLYISMQLWALLSSFAYAKLYAQNSKLEQSRIDKSINFMKAHLQATLSLKDIATSVKTSASHFSALFKQQTGYAPLNYFILLKMQEACRLLSLSGMSIKEIAFHLGYVDAYYFSRIFKKTIGVSPKLYQLNNQSITSS